MTQLTIAKPSKEVIQDAFDKGLTRYIKTRRSKVDSYVKDNYSFKGSLRRHKKSIGLDLLRVPLNILLMPITLITDLLAFLLKKIGLLKISSTLRKVPKSFETELDKEIKWLIYTELLELPYKDKHRESNKDALLDEVFNDTRLQTYAESVLIEVKERMKNPSFKQQLQISLAEYGTSKTAASEIASNVLGAAIAFATTKKTAFGSLGLGNIAATAIAHHLAVANFFLGSTAGAWYYSIAAASVPLKLLMVVTFAIIVILSIIATFIGIVTDPIQSKFGMHQRKLNKLIDTVEFQLRTDNIKNYNLHDKYVARVFDVIDALSMVGNIMAKKL